MKDKIKTIVCDMDGTLVDYNSNNFRFHSSWDALYDNLGLAEQNNKLSQEYYNKRELEVEWTDKQVSLLKGLSVKKALSGLFPLPYSKGAKSFFTSLDKRYIKGILTTGISLVADVIKEELNFDFSFSNILNHNNITFDGTYEAVVWLWKKAEKLKEISSYFNVGLENICFIGDNDNDIDCFKIVGLPIAFSPKKEEIKENVRYVIYDFIELKEILEKFE